MRRTSITGSPTGGEPTRVVTAGGPGIDALRHWFLPLLRMDTVPRFVQLIKLAQQEAGPGHERVRPPRLALANRPQIP